MSEKSAMMSPMVYLKIFFRRKEWVIIPTFIGLVLGMSAGLLMPKQFVSSTVMLVEEGKSDNPLFNNLAVSTTVGQRMQTIRESMLGWNSLVRLAKRLHLDATVKTPRELESLILGIRSRINIRLKGRNIITVAYLDEDPQHAQAVVKNITEVFIERNLEIQKQETSDAITFIEEQLNLYKGKIKSAEIAKLRDDLKLLLNDSTEAHPQVKSLREMLVLKENELRAENLEYTEDFDLGSGATNPLIGEIKKALEDIEGKTKSPSVTDDALYSPEFYKVQLIDKLDNVMARDVAVNEGIYNMLLKRLETAKITQQLQMSKEGTKYTVLDPPRVPLDPVKPNKILLALAGMVIGAGLGFSLIFGMEFFDKSFLDVEDANKHFNEPLLGAISKITTELDIKANRDRLVWAYSMAIIAGIVLMVITKAIASFLQT